MGLYSFLYIYGARVRDGCQGGSALTLCRETAEGSAPRTLNAEPLQINNE